MTNIVILTDGSSFHKKECRFLNLSILENESILIRLAFGNNIQIHPKDDEDIQELAMINSKIIGRAYDCPVKDKGKEPDDVLSRKNLCEMCDNDNEILEIEECCFCGVRVCSECMIYKYDIVHCVRCIRRKMKFCF